MRLGITSFAVAAAILSGASYADEPASRAGARSETGGVHRIMHGNLVVDGVPEIPREVEEQIQRYPRYAQSSFVDWTGDGGALVVQRFESGRHVHYIAGPQRYSAPVTSDADPVRFAAASPAGRNMLVVRDDNGDEFYQGYIRPIGGGEERRVTRLGTRNGSFVFSYDGTRLAHYSASPGSRHWRVRVVRSDTPGARLGDPGTDVRSRTVLDHQGAMRPRAWSRDNRLLLLARAHSATRNQLFVLNIKSGEMRELNPDTEAYYRGGVFTPNGRHVITVTDFGGEFRRLARISVRTGRVVILTPDLDWDVESFDVSVDGRTAVFSVNEGGASRVYLIDLGTGAIRPGPATPHGVISGLEFNPTGDRVGFSFEGPVSPQNMWSFDVRSLTLTRWTGAPEDLPDADHLVAPELIHYATFDEVDGQARQIPAYVYRPRAEGRRPVILYMHGGPESQYRLEYSGRIQYWAGELGVAVIAPNVRGSSGYGRTYLSLDDGVNREDSVRDVGALLDWIAEQPDLDPDRVVIYGGSYGGYLVLASMVHFEDRLAGGVNVVGISNFVTFLENTMGYRRNLRRNEYGDERDPEMRAHLEAISPVNHADRISAPLLVIQGANDPRVPASEADQMVEAVRQGGGEAWYLLALDEGHSFRNRSNLSFRRATETLFFETVLGLRG